MIEATPHEVSGRAGARARISGAREGSRYDETLDEFFLASRSLRAGSVVTLLLSTSFGVNAVLYATWLGYLMGIWAFAIQIAWSLSFLLIARFAGTVSAGTSLHGFLEQRFGSTTRRVAAVCSILGLAYFVGWEVNIAKSTVGGFTAGTGSQPLTFSWWFNRPGWVIAIVVGTAVLISGVFGRRLTARFNVMLNIVKTGLLVGVTATVGGGALLASQTVVGHAMIPSVHTAIAAIGISGLLTSLLFNLLWQFVDNSSWIAVASGRAIHQPLAARSLKWTGFWVFVTVNGLGTILGALLRGVSGVSSSNALAAVTRTTPVLHTVLVAAIAVLVLASVVSLVDVIVLAITQAAIVDLGVLSRKIRNIRVGHARWAVFVIGLLAAWGVNAWVQWLGGNIFEFVYVMIIAQLGLSGPVIVGLLSSRRIRGPMWVPIVMSVGIGIGAAVVGSALKIQSLVDSAGAATILISTLGAIALRVTMRGSRGSLSSASLT